MAKRRRIPGWLLALLLFGVPLLEIYVLIQVGRTLGVGWTIVLLTADSVLGGWLIKREGAKTARAFSNALASGRMPAREIADGILVLAGGLLMLSPGFVTDVFGILLILPFTRPLARGVLTRAVAARLIVPGQQHTRPSHSGPVGEGDVVEGEVIDPEWPDERRDES